MPLLNYRGYVASVDYDPSAAIYIATVQDIPDRLRFEADSVPALAEAMAQVVEDYIAMREEWGLPTTQPYNDDRRVHIIAGS